MAGVYESIYGELAEAADALEEGVYDQVLLAEKLEELYERVLKPMSEYPSIIGSLEARRTFTPCRWRR